MSSIGEFHLKSFFYASEAVAAQFNLSRSFAEAMLIGELFALEPEARERFDAIALGYPGLDGSADLKQAIAARYPGLTSDEVIATTGLDDALALLALSLVVSGDRVIVQTPAYQTYMTIPAWQGAEVVQWKARGENGWLPDLDELNALLDRPARWLMINFPNNPTGIMPDEAYFARLLELVDSHEILLISDEIYAGLPDTAPPLEPLCCRCKRAVSLHSVSKTLGVPGLRVGWIASRDDKVMRRIKDLRFHFNSYIGAPSEFLSSLALRREAEILRRNSKILAENIERANKFFASRENLFGWTPPAAGVNAWLEWRGPGTSRDLSDSLLRQGNLLLAHSALFDAGDRHMRLGLGCSDFAPAIERLGQAVEAVYA